MILGVGIDSVTLAGERLDRSGISRESGGKQKCRFARFELGQRRFQPGVPRSATGDQGCTDIPSRVA